METKFDEAIAQLAEKERKSSAKKYTEIIELKYELSKTSSELKETNSELFNTK